MLPVTRKTQSKIQADRGHSAAPQLDLLFGIVSPAEEGRAEAQAGARRVKSRRTWLVHQLVSEARELVEQELGDVWVEGEISNCRPAASGHLYFTLKDAEAQLPVVLFRRQAMLLRFKPEDGLHVRVRGKVSIYEQRGQLQLVAETMEPVGAGSLQLAFEQLRDRLKAEGLFEHERKQALPLFPKTVAIVTSPTGAVIRDFLNIVKRRHAALDVVIVPVVVQGDRAVAEIEAALRKINLRALADVIVLARGGGSLEDMAAFNSERVARAVAASELPVVSAIGHETDFTIADFVADLRAPTPSAAAELITEGQHKVADHVSALTHRLERAARFQMMQCRQRLTRLNVGGAEQRVITSLHRLEQRVDDLVFRAEKAVRALLINCGKELAGLSADVLRNHPQRRLSAARESLGASQSRLDHALAIKLASVGHFRVSLDARLYRAAAVHLAGRHAAFTHLDAKLRSLSPLAVLDRGYALVMDDAGRVMRSVKQISEGKTIATRLADGSFKSVVIERSVTGPEKKRDSAT